MNSVYKSFLQGMFFAFLPFYAYGIDVVGDMNVVGLNTDDGGYNVSGDIMVSNTGTMIITALDGGYINTPGTFDIRGDFIHDKSDESQIPRNNGNFAFTGVHTTVAANQITVGGNFTNGDGASPWNLTLDIEHIDVTGDFTAAKNSHMVIDGDSLTAGNIFVNGDVYLGNSGAASAVEIISNSYEFNTSGDFNVTGNLDGNAGIITVNAGNANISENVQGMVNMDVDSLSLGGATLDADTSKDWTLRFAPFADGDLMSTGSIDSVGDILVGGNVDGDLEIDSDADMWVGRDLMGIFDVDVKNLYVLGDMNGAGSIFADTVNIKQDLSGDVYIDADELNVLGNILAGAKFRSNLPEYFVPGADSSTPAGFHVNTDTGKSQNFKQMALTVNGTYYFDDNSYLQLVVNQANLNDAKMTVGGFDATDVTNSFGYQDMDTTPNLEILVDNIQAMLPKIKLVEVTGGGPIDFGDNFKFAGIWFYWDNNMDGINDTRLFQEAKLEVENNFIYAMPTIMDSIERMTALAADHSDNDIQVAKAIDDLILLRLQKNGYTDDNFQNYYTAYMRLLFSKDDVYYDLMLNGGSYHDAVDVMVSEDPNIALDFVKSLGFEEAAGVENMLIMASRAVRYAITDQLIEDYIWKRYYDKNIAWLRTSFGSDIIAVNTGIDKKIRDYVFGAAIGVGGFDFGQMSGYSVSLGLYGTYDWKKNVRAYADSNFTLHMADLKIGSNPLLGDTNSKLTSFDTIFDVGVIHRIFENYVTGRGYLSFGAQGGYKLNQQYHGQDFMDIKSENQFVMAPGYELYLGKDIWFSVDGFIRPSIKLGAEYNIFGGARRDLNFKFSESNIWRTYQTSSEDSSLWLRYGVALDMSFIGGTNFQVGYEVIKNGSFESNLLKLNGVYRF